MAQTRSNVFAFHHYQQCRVRTGLRRFSEEKIIEVLREQEAGATVADLCRKHGMSSATFYAWKAKYGGMDVSDARRLKALEGEAG